MRIERVDEKTVKCYLSNEEMAEYEITYKDFLTRTQKARDVVEQIIAQAVEEVGYKPPEFAMDMQIMMMPEKGMVLTLSEKMPDELANNPMLMDYLREMKRAFEQRFAQGAALGGSLEQDMTEVSGNTLGNLSACPGCQGKLTDAEDKMPEFAIFQFASLRDICDYVKILPKTLRVDSALYVNQGMYYLCLHKGGASYKRYSRTCIQALEYSVLYGAARDKLTWLQEHAECLISEKAVQKLRFGK